MLEYKRTLCENIADEYWDRHLEVDLVLQNKTSYLTSMKLSEVLERFDELGLDTAKDELLEWQEYRALAKHYLTLSKNSWKLFLTPKSRLESELEKAERNYKLI